MNMLHKMKSLVLVLRFLNMRNGHFRPSCAGCQPGRHKGSAVLLHSRTCASGTLNRPICAPWGNTSRMFLAGIGQVSDFGLAAIAKPDSLRSARPIPEVEAARPSGGIT